MPAPSSPLKIDAAAVPAEAKSSPKSLSANAAEAASVMARFSEAVGLKVPASQVPKYATNADVKTKRYHVGCIKGSPFNCMRILNREFPYMTGDITRNPNAPESTRQMEKLGCEMELADDELALLLKASTMRGWRYHGEPGGENVSSRWQCLRLGEPNVYFRPGDKLDAHFVYIVPMAEGERLYPGVMDNDGRDLPTPAPLLTE